ncbi:MAG TPA: hypothetical protein VID93_11330 [Acidimicrobiales bacterium]
MAGDEVASLDPGVSRRAVLGGAGKIAAAGAALSAAAGVVAPELASADAGGGVGIAPKGTTAIEFLAQIDQSGNGLIAYGYLTDVAGLSASDLFTSATHGEATARLTAYATGKLVNRAVKGSVHSLDIDGDLTIYKLATPGASFSDPASFTLGAAVAVYSLTIQDILTVIAPDVGIPTLIGDLRQTSAASVGGGHKFGQVGTKLRLVATGIGNRSQPDPPVATLSVAGNLSAV